MVMLLVNFVVEIGLFNGAVGKVVEIVYRDPSGPREKGAIPDYVVVDFPNVDSQKVRLGTLIILLMFPSLLSPIIVRRSVAPALLCHCECVRQSPRTSHRVSRWARDSFGQS